MACKYCEEEKALFKTEYELKCGAVHHVNLCKSCLLDTIKKEIVMKLYIVLVEAV